MKDAETFTVTITCRHEDLDETFKESLKNDIVKLSRYYQHIIDAYLIIDKQNSNFKVEMLLHVPGSLITAKDEDYNHVKAIDSVLDKVKTQLKKLKGKVIDHRTPVPGVMKEPQQVE